MPRTQIRPGTGTEVGGGFVGGAVFDPPVEPFLAKCAGEKLVIAIPPRRACVSDGEVSQEGTLHDTRLGAIGLDEP